MSILERDVLTERFRVICALQTMLVLVRYEKKGRELHGSDSPMDFLQAVRAEVGLGIILF